MQTEFYHVLNRGVEKRKIFMDSRDYQRFIHDLEVFNSIERVDPNHRYNKENTRNMDIGCPYSRGEQLVQIHFFCLMPNHYHLMLSPLVEGGVSLFMKKINMGYAKYFNERYKRSGSLFQGKYKSVHVTSDAHFMYLPFYIHLNPLDLTTPEWRKGEIPSLEHVEELLSKYKWSSHLDYSGTSNFASVTDRTFFLNYFGGTDGYTKALQSYLKKFDMLHLSGVTLE